jgi:hypothetical protein
MMIMQPTLGKVQERGLSPRSPETRTPINVTPSVKEIPYDYVATFILEGRRGNRVPQIINISTEGAFVAVAIGYSFIPPQLPRLSDPEKDATQKRLEALASIAIPGGRGQSINEVLGDPRMLLECLFIRLCGIDFKYSIVDSGSGRELQNLAIHNIAGLGESNGERPFRPMAKPMLFMPRSTIRIEVEEISEGPLYTKAELFIVLHGYKMLGYGIG